jgi:uncharacterized protein with HEPN domain
VSRDVTLYLDDMVDACRRIARYGEGLNREALKAGTMAYDAIVRNLEILGEACKGVPAEVRARDEEVAWRRIAGLRDVLAHAYFGIDEDIVWNVVSVEVPALLPRLIALRSALEPKSE